MRVISLIVFLAMAAYLGFYIVRRISDPVQTALTVTATMSDAAPMSGLVIRDELIIRSDQQYIDVSAKDGAKVAADEAVATVYGSEEALERANRLHTLSQEIQEVTASLSRAGNIQVSGDREQTIYTAISGISAALRGGSLTDVDAQSSALASILFRTETGETATEEYLQQLQDEFDQLRQTSAGDIQQITVGQNGTFSTVVDGYEGVDPEYAGQLTPTELRELIAADRVVDTSSIGKLITSFNWYYAAIVPREVARDLVAGMHVKLSFGRYYDGQLDADVELLGRAEDDEQVVVFRMEKGMADMLAVRAVSADMVYEEFTGLRVPLRGLYRYYAGYMGAADGESLTEGQAVTLSLGGQDIAARVSEVGSASAVGDLPAGVESGSAADLRPRRRLVVFCWPWSADEGPADASSGGGTVTVPGREAAPMNVTNYYDYATVISGREELDDSDPDKWDIPDRMCVFTMTGMQAERKLVSLIYAGDEYCLLSSTGTDALREGNEVIVRAKDLYNGKVFS